MIVPGETKVKAAAAAFRGAARRERGFRVARTASPSEPKRVAVRFALHQI
jgi:hypothetical protein